MYNLKEWWRLTIGTEPDENWDGKVLCAESDAQLTRMTNITQGFLACYTFTLVTQGWLTMNYNGNIIKIKKDDLYFYSPGLSVTILDSSPDYRSLCLLVDEFTTLESPAMRDMVSIAFLPIVQLSSPVLTLSPENAAMVEGRLREMINYQNSTNVYKDKLLRMLYAVFLVDLQNVQESGIVNRRFSPRVEEIFIGFNRLLQQHFVEHHDVGFYANELCVTNDYLSRIVKNVSGRTVIDYINQMLLIEASYLLRSTSLSISQISERLHFAEPASFTHFFSRHKGLSPREFRDAQ